MPIKDIVQPDLIKINDELSLKKYGGECAFALKWYKDGETVYMVDGVKTPYDENKLNRMYSYLDEHGELYFILFTENGYSRPIGDVTFSPDDMPIVIGDKALRGKGIGKRVISALIERAKILGYKELNVNEIYGFNSRSKGLFLSLGFKPYKKTARGYSYKLTL